MPPILHSEYHLDFVLFWSFKLILRIILFLYFASKKCFHLLLTKIYKNLIKLFTPCSINSIIHSAIVRLYSILSSDPRSCHWEHPRTYCNHCSCCHFSHFVVPLMCPVLSTWAFAHATPSTCNALLIDLYLAPSLTAFTALSTITSSKIPPGLAI